MKCDGQKTHDGFEAVRGKPPDDWHHFLKACEREWPKHYQWMRDRLAVAAWLEIQVDALSDAKPKWMERGQRPTEPGWYWFVEEDGSTYPVRIAVNRWGPIIYTPYDQGGIELSGFAVPGRFCPLPQPKEQS